MWSSFILPALISLLAVRAEGACNIPSGTPSNTITTGFRIQVQNASHPNIHDRYLNFEPAGGGDQHLYLSPDGNIASDITLVEGMITEGSLPIRAVINGQYTPEDNTSKLFMTQRGDPRAIFNVRYTCRTGKLQKEIVLSERQGGPKGGTICVRLASGERYEFRYSPPGNKVMNKPGAGGFSKGCIEVVMVVT